MHSHTLSIAQIQPFLRPGSENQMYFLFIPPALYENYRTIISPAKSNLDYITLQWFAAYLEQMDKEERAKSLAENHYPTSTLVWSALSLPKYNVQFIINWLNVLSELKSTVHYSSENSFILGCNYLVCNFSCPSGLPPLWWLTRTWR